MRGASLLILWAITGGGSAAADAPQRPAEVTVQPDLVYVERGDQQLKADVYQPAGTGPFPGVLMVHGGAWAFGDKRQMADHARAVAAAGYVVVSIDYRLAPGDKFPAQLEDCQQALSWMRGRAAQLHIDPQRIAGWGYSAGGHLIALLGLLNEPAPHTSPSPPDAVAGRLRAVVAGGAICDFDWLGEDSQLLSFFLGGSRGENPEIYQLAAPVHHVSPDDPPMWLFHGQFDRLAPLSGPQQLAAKLQAAGVPVELEVVWGEGHVGTFFDPAARRRAIAFLDKVLQLPSDVATAGSHLSGQ